MVKTNKKLEDILTKPGLVSVRPTHWWSIVAWIKAKRAQGFINWYIEHGDKSLGL